MDTALSSTFFDLLVIGACIALSAFFSGMEIAFVSSDKNSLKAGRYTKILKLLTKNSSKFIIAMVIGNNVALVIYSLYASDLMEKWVSNVAIFEQYPLVLLLIKTTVSTFFILLLAEFLPKVFFNVYAHQMLKKMMLPATIFYGIFYLPTIMVNRITNVILNIFKEVNKQQKFLKQYNRANTLKIAQTTPLKKEQFSKLITPKNALPFVKINDTPEKIMRICQSKNLSRILVYDENKTIILGYIKAANFFKPFENISDILRPVIKIKEPFSMGYALEKMKKQKQTMALVYDKKQTFCGVLKRDAVIEMLLG